MNWEATRERDAALRDGKPVGSRVYPYGAETYFTQNGELCRRFARHPGTQVHRNAIWTWL